MLKFLFQNLVSLLPWLSSPSPLSLLFHSFVSFLFLRLAFVNSHRTVFFPPPSSSFACCLLSSFFSVLRSFFVCSYTVVFCFHLVIYNFVNLMLSRLRVPSSLSKTHSLTHSHTPKHNHSNVLLPPLPLPLSYRPWLWMLLLRHTKPKRSRYHRKPRKRSENNLCMCALNTFANISYTLPWSRIVAVSTHTHTQTHTKWMLQFETKRL